MSLGLTVLGAEQTHALFQQAAARGEVMESEAQQMLDARRRQLADGAVAKLPSRLAALLNQVPDVSSAAKPAVVTAAAISEVKPVANEPDLQATASQV